MASRVLPAQLTKKFSGKSNFDSQLSTLLGKVDTDGHSIIETARLELKKFLATSLIGRVYENALLIFSVLSCVLYISQTYITETRTTFIFDNIEFVLACMFGLDWLMQIFIADHKWEHFFSFFPMVDLMTIIPTMITYGMKPGEIEEAEDPSEGKAFLYIMRAARVLRVLRILRFHRKLNNLENNVQRKLSQMMLSILAMLIFDVGLMQYLEAHQRPRPFHEWVYFLVVTISTVGFGDIAPKTSSGRMAVIFMICFAIIYVPKQSNELIEMLSRSSIYSRISYRRKGANSKHVLICGDLRSTSLLEFFNELFHDDHDNVNLNAVVLQPEPPNTEMDAILKDPIFSLLITYLEGSPLVEADLKRAHADTAIAVFLLTNKFSLDPDEEDAKTILQQFAIKRFVTLHNPDRHRLFCTQLIRPENRRHLIDATTSEDLVVCLNELKMGFIAKTCLFPGTSTLLFNLLSSFAEDEEDNDASGDEVDDDDPNSWMAEYQKGCDWEIYTTEMADVFEGARFSELAETLYLKLGVILFALRVTDITGRSGISKLVLNPGDYTIPSKKHCKLEGFVIAKNKASSDLSFSSAHQDRVSQIGMIANTMSKAGDFNKMDFRSSVTSLFRNDDKSPRGSERHQSAASAHGSPMLKDATSWNSMNMNGQVPPRRAAVADQDQEQIHRMEDRFLKRHFFMRTEAVSLEDVTITTSVAEEAPFVQEHLIVIGKNFSNLYDFVRPLRAKYLGKIKFIVILHPHDIPHHIWKRISTFKGILFIKGSPLEESDIRRAGVFRASQVVVLAENTGERSSGMEALVDADAIFAYQHVRRLNEQAHVVVEIVHHANVDFLDPVLSMVTQDVDYKFTPQFAAGMLFTSALLDTILCQAFYNPSIVQVINKMIAGAVKVQDSNEKRSKNFSSTHPRQSQAHLNFVGSNLYQIPIPEGLENRTYGDLFKALVKDNVLPIALLRGTFAQMSLGPRANKMPYVFTNPPKETELFSCDKVFVLAQRPIVQTNQTVGEVAADVNAMNMGDKMGKDGDWIDRVGGKPGDSEREQEIQRLMALHSKMQSDVNKLRKELKSMDGKLDSLMEFTSGAASTAGQG